MPEELHTTKPMGDSYRLDWQRQGCGHLRTARHRRACRLVAEATNIVASKYFHGKLGTSGRETSVAQLVHRVVDTIADWGLTGNYFKSEEDGENFRSELAHLMLTQKACFNSPVWFNVGVKDTRGYGWCFDEDSDSIKILNKGEKRPQCSACFIVSVQDTLESILDLAKTEGMLFKWDLARARIFRRCVKKTDCFRAGAGRPGRSAS